MVQASKFWLDIWNYAESVSGEDHKASSLSAQFILYKLNFSVLHYLWLLQTIRWHIMPTASFIGQ